MPMIDDVQMTLNLLKWIYLQMWQGVLFIVVQYSLHSRCLEIVG